MRWRLLRSSSFRLALVHALLFAGSVLVLLGFIYWATAGTMQRQAEATIEAEVQGLAEQYQRRGLAGLTEVISRRLARAPGGASVYLLADPAFTPLLGNLERWPAAGRTRGDEARWIDFRLGDAPDARPARARHFRLHGGLHLLVGRDVHELEATRGLILRALIGGLGLTLVLALGGGVLVGRGGLRRIEAINQTSREIMAGDLSRRVPVRGTGDDLDELAANLNAMLDRIESLMEDVRRVSDNIAHDLRTPLARLRGRLEALGADCAREPERAGAVRRALHDADALMATFNALLRIARIESGRRRAPVAAVDLADVVRDVVDLYEPLAEEAGMRVTLDLAAGATVRGDRNLLFQAIGNVLDNAVKYGGAGGLVAVRLTAGPGRARLAIADRGPGVPPELRAKVLGRFYRGDWSRSTSGSGLGLSLVAAVCELHGATLTLGDAAPGLEVSFDLPRIEAGADPASAPAVQIRASSPGTVPGRTHGSRP